jgi:hypothetical protein
MFKFSGLSAKKIELKAVLPLWSQASRLGRLFLQPEEFVPIQGMPKLGDLGISGRCQNFL